jgi:signal transduction histidine kinase/ligand-binding sensor domain-containing protein/DNA-binding response OmpR family regulator
MFENINLGAGATVIDCFLQDSQGLIWIGSNKGLFSYDGYNVQPHFTFDERSNTQIYCGVIADKTRLYLGADNGILIYNLQTDRYEETPAEFPTDVRTLSLQGDTLWMGTLNGLFWFDLKDRKLKNFDRKKYRNLPHQTIYSIIRTHDNQIFIGTYDGLCRYLPGNVDFRKIALPLNPRKNNQFINSLLEDTARQCIWIGMEGNLLKYSIADESIKQVDLFHDNSVKSLALDGNSNLLVGTDNGLYVYNESEPAQHVMHDSRNRNSLSNNIIWNIFTDQNQNIWLGTDYGISLSRYNRSLQNVPISEITGTGEGNQLYSIFRDSRNNYWFGGTNGIIRVKSSIGNHSGTNWYNMGDQNYPIPHGRIRHIYEDTDADLWIATDGSINRFDYKTSQFIHYNILDSTGTYNTNWAYYLFEDDQGQLWIATCLGGIFVVNKNKLIQSANGSYVADYNYSTRNGLSGMFINQIIPDQEGNVWVLLYNNGIDKIVTRSREVYKLPLGELTGGKNPTFILCDKAGFIWAGFRGGVMRITPKNNQIETIMFDTFSSNEVLSMMEADGNLWISTTDGFWLVDMKTLKARYLNLSDKRFLSMFFDEKEDRIYLGDVDGFAIASPEILTTRKIDRPIIATALYVNSQLMESGQQSIRYASRIDLNYQENYIAVELSDLPYSLEEKNKFVYRLEPVDRNWNLLSTNSNRISYSNLSHGSYRLVVSKLDITGQPSESRYSLDIVIRPPWYYTIWAKSVYILLLLSLAGWTINFFRVKNRLKIERIEKEKILEQSRMKMDFFTNLSHELKTPLSMIIAPVSRLLHEIRGTHEKQQLKLVQHNAMKLNSLIHQMLDFDRMDSKSNSLLILSRTELVAFARNLFSVFEETEKESGISFRFESNQEKVYLELDVIKWESILNNLLSNAVKYTSDGGTVTLSLNVNADAGEIEIRVSDTGSGIPSQDIPYIFQRFFQSSKTAGKKEGTGIGLYLVKTYSELHGGIVSITSEENVGTTVTIKLPVSGVMSENEKPLVADLDKLQDTEKPLILVVDDNPEITGFISDILQSRYRCCTAGNGLAGIELCFELMPDLIISDIMMPGMNGLEMCQQIRKHVPTSTIPIILLTAKDDKKTELESIQLNIDAFIPKPFEPDILLSRIEQLIQKNQSIEARIRMETIATPKEIEAVSYDEKFLSGITHIIEDHLSDSELNVTALCEISGINNKQIYRKLKQLTGMTPVEYIKSIRMKKAAMLLQQQKFSVAEVMYMVGFSNHSYFSRCFKAEFDKTPWQYKEEQYLS